jgi:GDPmannose 4,6-dehydratase
MLTAEREPVRADAVSEGDELALAEDSPPLVYWTVASPELAQLLGLLAADGDVSREGGGICFTNDDEAIRARVGELWSRVFLGRSAGWTGASGLDPARAVQHLDLTGAHGLGPWLREQLYTPTGHKQVPPLVLNAGPDSHDAFLEGYHAGDGLERGKDVSVTTNSPVLAQGLCWLYHVRDQRASVYVEQRAGRAYYHLNVPSAVRVGAQGRHLREDPAEVRRVRPPATDDGWVFDLETESGVFCAGVGRLVLHNSPRRGETFVTRKVTRAVARIRAGLQEKLFMGNLDAKRDWGYAPDFVEAMWLMLQADEPDDFVIATGETHSVREFLEASFRHVGLDWQDHVEIDPRYFRPSEVDALLGDSSKARERLGWRPTVTFDELVRLMVDADVGALDDQLAGRVTRYSHEH